MIKQLYIGLGSNLGNRLDYLQTATGLLAESLGTLKLSSVYETAPVGYVNQNSFLNMAVSAETDLDISRIHAVTRQIEYILGRQRVVKWGPRIIDIDILLIGSLIYKSDDLEIPHPEMLKRRFVLEPLCEIDDSIPVPPDMRPVKDYLVSVMDQELKVFVSKESRNTKLLYPL
ncbi:MAG: 2-amino-4-hydroxy-6-hydroxymethyldihydropteridine diphosphokinase [Spirochaetota bacterium]|nr:2-amino-4-hydroxy-6-hydroxymethyldihydropteridine diphosphokinase [Spirochaetota bacterium]